MKTLLKILLLIAILIFSESSIAQHVVSVNEFTGSATTEIPLWNISSKDISHKVALRYYTSGLQVGSQSGEVGLGWILNAGGRITRGLNGIPDELKSGDGRRIGWLRDNTHAIIGNFTPEYTGELDGCSALEVNDYNFLSGLGGFDMSSPILDSEPDVFSISVQGLNTQFVFNNNGEISLLSNRNLQINTTFNATTNAIESFVITDERGVKYYFSDPVAQNINAETAGFEPVLRKYEYYKLVDGFVYNTLWHLTKISSPAGGNILFKYESNRNSEDVDEFGHKDLIVSWNSTRDDSTSIHMYEESSGYQLYEQYRYRVINIRPKDLVEISTDTYKIELKDGFYRIPLLSINETFYGRDLVLKRPLLNWISIYALRHNKQSLVKKFIFNYDFVRNLEDLKPSHVFLKSVQESSGNFNKSPYIFQYYNLFEISELDNIVTPEGDTSPLVGSVLGDLPKRNSENVDYFGFYSKEVNTDFELFKQYVYPEYDGYNRYRKDPIANYSGEFHTLEGKSTGVDARSILSGALKSITTQLGAKTTIFYEPNMYYDALALGDVYGGGIRAKKLITNDGASEINDLITNYEYLNQDGTSSGIAVQLPTYSITNNLYVDPGDQSKTYMDELANDQNKWEKLTLRFNKGLRNNGGPTVGYKRVKVSVPGKGSIVTKYQISADYLSTDGANYNSSPIKVARDREITECSSIDLLQVYMGIYGAENQDGESQFGQVSVKQEFDENNVLIRERSFQYETNNSSEFVQALKLHKTKTKALIYNPITQQNSLVEMPIFLYDQYKIWTMSAQFPSIVENIEYDDTGNSVSEQTYYTYNFNIPNNLKEKRTVLPTGDEYRTVYKYVEDYLIQADNNSRDEMSNALSKLKEKGIGGRTIEETVYYRPVSQAEKVIGGTLILYKDFGNEVLLPYKTLTLKAGNGLTDFSSSDVTFVSGNNNFEYDGRYEVKSTSEDIDHINHRVSGVKSYTMLTTGSHLDYEDRVVICDINGALASEVLYNNFESFWQNKMEGLENGFAFKNTQSTSAVFGDMIGEGRGLYSKGLKFINSSADFALGKDIIKQKNTNYIFSFWAKSGTSTDIIISCTDGSDNITKSQTVSDENDWDYYEMIVPVGQLLDNVSVDVTGNTDVLIDDILFYPEGSTVVVYQYNDKYLKVSETVADKASYYQYDDFGNVRLVLNNEGNILQRNKVNYPYNASLAYSAMISYNDELLLNIEKTFYAGSTLEGATYYWAIEESQLGEQAPEDYDYSGIAGTNSATATYTLENEKAHTIYLKIDYAGKSYYAILDNLRAIPTNLNNGMLTYCVNGAIRFDVCEIEEPIMVFCQSGFAITAEDATLISIDDGGYTGTVEYRWDIFSHPPIEDFDINSILNTHWNTSDTWSAAKQSKMISNYNEDIYLKGYMRVNGSSVGETPIIHIDAYYSQETACNSN